MTRHDTTGAQRMHYSDDTLTLLVGDAVEQLRTLPDGAVNCVVTSPPYFGLRDYGGLHGQIGLESSPAEYVAALGAVFAEVHRVLADDGTLWLNLGDSYAYPPGSSGTQGSTGQRADRTFTAAGLRGTRSLPPKNLLGIPWRVAFALQDAGWVLRSEIVWAKRNIMPEAVKDRPTRAHEQVFLLTKGPRYWYDAEAIREESDPAQEAHNQRYAREYQAHTARAAETGQPGNVNSVGVHSRPGKGGRNARSVWTISSTPLKEAHFATFPAELPRRCIAAGCKPDGVVLDPFSGAGTTAMAAQQLGRRAIGIDLNPAYHDIALRRMADAPLPFGETA
ncbi:DNA-methyltransferase [Actinosynnema sp. NPDC059335]|uniref:DNA-methyltransferase n=1 Tax=Actinosynnema sp. NPDC059335 TaxID=3346804 RepID=UPI00366C03CB